MTLPRIVAVYGQTGYGKSTLAAELVRDVLRLVAFDPMGDLARRPGFHRYDNLGALHERFRRGRFAPIRAAWIPPANGDHVAALSALSDLVWTVQGATRGDDIDAPPITVLVDEMSMSYPVQVPRQAGGFTRLVLQGRHHGINLVGITQRPALIGANFRSNAGRSYVFRLGFEADRKAALQLDARGHVEALRTLAPFHYLTVENGDIGRGQVKKPA